MEASDNKPAPKTTTSVYVNAERFTHIMQLAIDVSNETRVQVTPSQFVQHLVDHYGELARQNWVQTVAGAARDV